MAKYEFSTTLNDLDGGQFAAKVAKAIKASALAAVESGEKSEVTLKFTLKRIGESCQVTIDHALQYKHPTKRGWASELDTTQTQMFVRGDGELAMSFQAGEQQDMFADKSRG